jgi:membrane protein implicated in regulation of membrane protease activity
MNTPIELLFWHWWAAGLLLLALEAFFPGAVFLWMGASALVTGLLAWLLPLPWQGELAVFSALSIVSFFAYKKLRPAPAPSDQPTLNRRGDAYLGRRLTLSEPIVNGIGRVRMDDTQWRISGPDLPAGSQVEVIAVDGATLKVKAT